MKKIFLLCLFNLAMVVVFGQNKTEAYLTNIKNGVIKLSQLTDTSIKIAFADNVKGNCNVVVYFHEGGFRGQVASMSFTGRSPSFFNLVSGSMKSKMTVGTKITIGECFCIDKRVRKKYNLSGTTYIVVAD